MIWPFSLLQRGKAPLSAAIPVASATVPQVVSASRELVIGSGFNIFAADDVTIDFLWRLTRTIPVIDAALDKKVLLIGDPYVEIPGDPQHSWAEQVNEWLQRVPVNQLQNGISQFMRSWARHYFAFGRGVGEIVWQGGPDAPNTIAGLLNVDARTVGVKRNSDNPLDVQVVQKPTGFGFTSRPYGPYSLMAAFRGDLADNVNGISLVASLPLVADALQYLHQAIRAVSEREADATFLIKWVPPADYTDNPSASGTGTNAGALKTALADQWESIMQKRHNGLTREDFIAVGDVRIEVAGAQKSFFDFEIAGKPLLEQIVARMGIPPFMLGFQWATTERLSSEQRNALQSDIDSERRAFEPDLRKLILLGSLTNGFGLPPDEWQVAWSAVSLADAELEARVALTEAQAEEVQLRNVARKWELGFIDQLGAAEELGYSEVVAALDAPPAAPAPPTLGALSLISEDNGGGRKMPRPFQRRKQPEAPKNPKIPRVVSRLHAQIVEVWDRFGRDVDGLIREAGNKAAEDMFVWGAAEDAKLREAYEAWLLRFVGGKEAANNPRLYAEAEGILQQGQRFSWALGVARAAEVMEAAMPVLAEGAETLAVQSFMERAFELLTQRGANTELLGRGGLRVQDVLDEVRDIIAGGMRAGVNAIEMGKRMSTFFEGQRTGGNYNWERLARTEVAFAENRGFAQELHAEGVVEGIYDISPTAEDDLCLSHTGETFLMSDYLAGSVDEPPFHPSCLCSILPLIPELPARSAAHSRSANGHNPNK